MLPDAAEAPPPAGGARRKELVSGVGVLLLLVAIFHGPSLNNGFVYDDAWTIVSNPIIRRPANVLSLLGPGPARDLVPDAGRPALLATEILDYALWELSPRGYHLQNLFWHAAVVVLWFLAVASWAGGLLLPLTAAALFAIHPLNVEAVAAINYREDLLAAFFTLLAIGAVATARTRDRQGQGGAPTGRRRWESRAIRAAAFVFLMLGAFSKENTLMAPLLLVVLDVCGGGARAHSVSATLRSRWKDYLLLSTAALTVFAWRWWVMGGPGIVSRTAEVPAADEPLSIGVLQSSLALLRGLGQLAMPVGFSPVYPEPPAGLAASVMGMVAGLVLAGLAAFAFRQRRRNPQLAFGVLAGMLAYLPNMGLVPLTNLRADRYFYLPSLAFLLAAACLLQAGLSRVAWFRNGTLFELPRPWLALGVIVTILGARTLRQGRIWRSDLSLWSFAAAAQPSSPGAWSGLATAHLRGGRTVEALRAAEKSLAIADDGHTHHLLGIILMQQGALPRAHAALVRALASGVTNRGEVLNNLGYCELRLKRPREALLRFQEAQHLDPRNDRPWLNAARAHQDLAEPEQMLRTLRGLVERIPESVDGWKQLAFSLEARGDKAGAREALDKATALASEDDEIRRARARLMRP